MVGLKSTAKIRVQFCVGILILVAVISTATAGLRCYSCSSYMNQCKTVVARSPSHVGRNDECLTRCFVRAGEDGAIYRGCFDDFVKVVHLQANYIGCKNQTWNNRSLRWCFCSSDLCNGVGMETLEAFTESAPTKPELSVLHTYTVTTAPAVLNTDHVLFKYLEDEEVDEVDRAVTRQRPTRGGRRSNAVPSMAKPNREIFKQLNGERYYERMDNPMNIPMKAGNAFRQALQVSNEVKSENKVKSTAVHQIPVPAVRSTLMEPDEENFDGDYELNNADYPRNQKMRSISKIVQAFSKIEDPNQLGLLRSDDNVSTKEVSSSEVIQTPNIRLKSSKKKSNSEEPLPFNPQVSSELASTLTCEESGYYQHPSDCTLYMACVYDPYTRSPIWHQMRCPELLFWDNERKICVEFPINCVNSEGLEEPPIRKLNAHLITK